MDKKRKAEAKRQRRQEKKAQAGLPDVEVAEDAGIDPQDTEQQE